MTPGPYPMDEPVDYDDKAEESGPYMHWETANPEWWVPRGHAEMRVEVKPRAMAQLFREFPG